MQRSKRRPRFSLLTCLEYGEVYFGDHAATLLPNTAQVEQLGLRWSSYTGRIMVASGSLTFEPDDNDAPLLRLLLRDVKSPLVEWAAMPEGVPPGFQITCDSISARREKFEPLFAVRLADAASLLRFSLQHAQPADFVRLLNGVLEILRQPHAATRLQALHQEQELSKTFDQTALLDPLELQLDQLRVERVRPMLSVTAILLVTESRVYISEASGASESPLTHWPLTALLRVVRRRHLLRHTALELQFRRGSGSDGNRSDLPASSKLTSDDPDTLLINVGEHQTRELLFGMLHRTAAGLDHPLPPPPDSRLNEMGERWRHGLIDNFEYLMYLNDAAGRSLSDLAQYPVMPWVVADYTSSTLDLEDAASFRDLSKPVGALTPSRLALFRERCASMEEDSQFLYGTHYSAPAFVAYFLLRLAPELTLHLHNGKFDEPDRAFSSVGEAWSSALTASSDVKELIPQFYHPAAAPFLLNQRDLQLGRRQNGRSIADVALPPWASSPRDFVAKCRAALECEHVSQTLHLWIDLVFGHKQRGAAADAADNLFCPETYEGGIDLAAATGDARRALELQVAEFGQTPSQLFLRPHPPRLPGASKGALVTEPELAERLLHHTISGALPPLPPHLAAGAAAPATQPGPGSDAPVAALDEQLNGLTLGPAAQEGGAGSDTAPAGQRAVARLHEGPVAAVCYAEDGTTVCSTAASQLGVYCTARPRLLRRAAVGEHAVRGVAQLRGLDLLCLGTADAQLHLYSVGRGGLVQSVPRAHVDAISCLRGSWGGPERRILSGSYDSTVRLWALAPPGLRPLPLCTLEGHKAKVLCLSNLVLDQLVASGTAAGDVALWDVRTSGGPVHRLRPHAAGAEATGVALDDGRRGLVTLSCAADGSVSVSEMRSARSVSLRAACTGGAQRCAQAYGGGALTAGDDGVLRLWSTEGLVGQLPAGADGVGEIRCIDLWQPSSGPARPLDPGAFLEVGVRVVAGHASGAVSTWTPSPPNSRWSDSVLSIN